MSVFLFGANNTGVKYMMRDWPPVTVGTTRFFLVAALLMALQRWTPLFGGTHPLTPELKRRLWRGSGLIMAVYIVAFNGSLKLTDVSHVAVYLGAAPVWALLWEGQPERHWKSAQRYGAAALAFSGVLVLLWPVLRHGSAKLPGEFLGLSASVLWAAFGRQCRALGRDLSSGEITAQTFWRSGVLLTPIALVEVCTVHIPWRADLAWIQLFCIVGGGVAAFGFWNNALRHWKTSQVSTLQQPHPDQHDDVVALLPGRTTDAHVLDCHVAHRHGRHPGPGRFPTPLRHPLGADGINRHQIVTKWSELSLAPKAQVANNFICSLRN